MCTIGWTCSIARRKFIFLRGWEFIHDNSSSSFRHVVANSCVASWCWHHGLLAFWPQLFHLLLQNNNYQLRRLTTIKALARGNKLGKTIDDLKGIFLSGSAHENMQNKFLSILKTAVECFRYKIGFRGKGDALSVEVSGNRTSFIFHWQEIWEACKLTGDVGQVDVDSTDRTSRFYHFQDMFKNSPLECIDGRQFKYPHQKKGDTCI